MRYEALYLSAPTCVYGETLQTAHEAVGLGCIDAETAQRWGYDALPTSRLAPVELALSAARQTLADSALAAPTLNWLLHAWTHRQGQEFWSPAHYLADQLGARAALPVGIQQMCNGGVTALDLAAARLCADTGTQWALATTADCFCAPSFDRWQGDLGVAYGDGATAALLGRGARHRALRLHAICTTAAAELEGMHRYAAGFDAHAEARPLRPRDTKKQFMCAHPDADFAAIAQAALRRIITQALDEAGLRPDAPRLRWAALPRLAEHILAGAYRPGVRAACAAEPIDFARCSGHLGAGDTIANIVDLWDREALHPGDYALLISAGAGFTWSCAVVERPQTPAQIAA